MVDTVLVYDYAAQGGQPPSGKCYQSQSSPDLISFSFTDANSNNNTTFLNSVAIDSQITCNGVTWAVTAILPRGSNIQFTVTPNVTAPPFAAATSFTFSQAVTEPVFPKKYFYLVDEMAYQTMSSQEMEDRCNQLGEQGWQLLFLGQYGSSPGMLRVWYIKEGQ
jgi:hypothetical protein